MIPFGRCLSNGSETRQTVESSGPRILLTGVPIGIGSDKVVRLIEESGATVVCFETCGGYKRVFTIDERRDPVTAIAEQYLSTPAPSCLPIPAE